MFRTDRHDDADSHDDNNMMNLAADGKLENNMVMLHTLTHVSEIQLCKRYLNLIPLYLISHVPLWAQGGVALAVVDPCFHNPLIVKGRKTTCLIEQFVNKFICPVRLHLQIWNKNSTIFWKNVINSKTNNTRHKKVF